MTERFFDLSPTERSEALQVAASNSGRPLHILEKDIWVVWTLAVLFEAPFGEHLVFKGGTSLSKAYAAIDRFSEDIDVTYDIRTIADDLVKGHGSYLPSTKSQGRAWTDKIRERLDVWLNQTALPYIKNQITSARLDATARIDNKGDIYIDYTPQAEGYGYIPAHIKIEFGARDTGEPSQSKLLICDASAYLPNVSFPTATPSIMIAERTAWEKMTAIHVFCKQQAIKKNLARHWYDIAKLDSKGYINSALLKRDIATQVAGYKKSFFESKDHTGTVIDYFAAVNGGLILVPTGTTYEALASDYAQMVQDRLFLGNPEPFTWIVERCEEIARRANVPPAEG
jgi:Nucleotidyl transferase AbiEii toxin, Type IV TA system